MGGMLFVSTEACMFDSETSDVSIVLDVPVVSAEWAVEAD